MYKIIGADGREYGPVSAADLRRWIAEGRVNAQSQLRVEGGTDWRPLGSFPELAATAPAPFPIMAAGSGSSSRTNGMAIAGFVSSLLGLICCCFGPPFSIIGLVFSCVGLSQIKENPMQGGKGLAIAGIVLAILGLLLGASGTITWLANAARNPF
ncbi:MAG TPA: DUF4190 domain-containing protein [Candidatus Acidoferrum sp.]|nr:DUF4190 domain-containing protein [Candidatus Acidoferrum sp.]